MARVRKVCVTRVEKGKWAWNVKGVLWEFRLQPMSGLWRAGVIYSDYCEKAELRCVDDAVLFSHGFEASLPGAFPGQPCEEDEG